MPSISGARDAFRINGIGRLSHNSSVFLTREACDFQMSVTFGVLGRVTPLNGKETRTDRADEEAIHPASLGRYRITPSPGSGN